MRTKVLGRRFSIFSGRRGSKKSSFVRGTTEGVNLIAQTYGRKFLQPGDEIVLFDARAPREHRAVADDR